MFFKKKPVIEGKPVTFNAPKSHKRMVKRAKRLRQQLAGMKKTDYNYESFDLELQAIEIGMRRNGLA